MRRILLKVLFNTYMYIGIFLLASFIISVVLFLLQRGVFVIADLEQHSTAFETLIKIISDLTPAIAGTFLITVFSVLLAIPIGLTTGVFINEYTKGSVQEMCVLLFKLVAGIPSIVIGVFGFVALLTLNHLFDITMRTSFLVAGMSLTLLILPYIVLSTILALQQVSQQIRVAALSLGAKKYQNIFRVLLPECFSSLSSGIILAIGRACEDTAVIMLTGVAAYAGVPSSLHSSFEALPFYIYYHASDYQNKYELTTVFVATIIIIAISTTFIMIASVIKNKIDKKLKPCVTHDV